MQILNIIIFIIIFYFVYNTYLKYRKVNKYQLKGPTPLPVIGSLHLFGKGELPHEVLGTLSKEYGNIYRIWFGDVHTVVVSDPILIREMYVDKSEIFENRPKLPSIKCGSNYHSTSTSRGEDWRKNREIVSKAMKKINLKHVYQLVDNQVDNLINSMNQDIEFDPNFYFTKYARSSMFKFIFNQDISKDDEDYKLEISELMKPLQEFMFLFGSGNLFDYLEITQPFYLYWLEFNNKSINEVMSFFKNKLDQHLETYDQNQPSRDLLDILIKEYGTNSDDTILSILSTVGDFFFGGVDTTANALEWMVLVLCNYPDVQEKVYNEIKSVIKIGDDKVMLSDRVKMPYLVAVIKETLRFKPISPFGLPRSSSIDCTIGGHFIPKDSQIIVDYKSLLWNENYFENPNEFDPTRFLKSESNIAFIPFSIGPRNCVGMNLSLDEIFLCISNVLLKFKLSSIDGNLIDDSVDFSLLLKPKNHFKVSLQKR